MPLYDYRCEHCRAVFEVRATFKEKDAGLEPECPHCQSKKTRQLLATGMLLLPVHEGLSGASSGCSSGCSSGNCASCRK